jgi:hypothetical protein
LYKLAIFATISVAQFAYINFCSNFMFKSVCFLKITLRELFQPYFTGNKILITKNIIQKSYFYDVNSMYPYMMLNFLPNEYRGLKVVGNLDLFFGFVFVSLKEKPVNKFYSELNFGIIFSEELKMLIKLGYKFQFHYFLSFSREKLF